MTVVFQANFKRRLEEWARQSEPKLNEYRIIPVHVGLYSVKMKQIDGLCWEKDQPRKEVKYVISRCEWNGVENKWILPLEVATNLGGRTLTEPVRSLLYELSPEKLDDMIVEIGHHDDFVGAALTTMARHVNDQATKN